MNACRIAVVLHFSCWSWIVPHSLASTFVVKPGQTVNNEVVGDPVYSRTQKVYGTANNTRIIENGWQAVSDGGVTNHSTVINGGRQNIYAGGTANNTMVLDNGIVEVTQSGVANSTVIHGKNSIVFSATYGVVNNTQVLADSPTTKENYYSQPMLLVTLAGVANNSVVYGVMQNKHSLDEGTIIKSGGVYVNLQYYPAPGLSGNLQLANTELERGFSNNALVELGGLAFLGRDADANNWKIKGTVSVIHTSYGNFPANINNAVISGGNLFLATGIAKNTIVDSGHLYNIGGIDTGTVINDGAFYFAGYPDGYDHDIAYSKGLVVNSGGSASLAGGVVEDTSVSGNMFVGQYATKYSSTIQSPLILKGTLSINNSGAVVVSSDANIKNANVQTSGMLFLKSIPSAINNYQFTAMNMNGGAIIYTPSSAQSFSRLTLTSLSGSGLFYMNTNLAGGQSDFLSVTGEANGNFNVYVSDSGANPGSMSDLQIIQTGGGNANFSLANKGGVVDVGTYEYQLVANGSGGWLLTPEINPTPPDPTPPTPPTPPEPTPPNPTPPIPPMPPDPSPTPKPVITPSTAAVLSMGTVDPLIFQTELAAVREHLAQTQDVSLDHQIWGYYSSSDSRVGNSAGAGYEMSLNGVTIGVDNSVDTGNGKAIQGGFFSYSHSKVDFDRQGEGGVDSYSLGVYARYLHHSGEYLEGVLKANHFSNDVDARMTSGMAANGHYSTSGIGANIEGGKYFYFADTYLAPYLAVTGFTTNANNYRLSNEMDARLGSQRSVVGEAGVRVGHSFALSAVDIEPFARAAIAQEFIDDNEVNVNDDPFTNDMSGARGIYMFGVNALLKTNTKIYADASYSEGQHLESPWTVNLGVSMRF